MTSGDVLKYRKGFLIRGGYEASLPASTYFLLTKPVEVLGEDVEIGVAATLDDDAVVPTLTLTVPARLRRTGMEKRLLIEGAGPGSRGKVEPNLVKLIAKAQELQAVFLRGNASIQEMAAAAGMTGSYFTRIVRLSFLAPEISRAILQGRQPTGLNARKLMANTRLPLRRDEQRAQLGFD